MDDVDDDAGVVPPGIVIGSDDRELFATMAHLDSLDAVAKAVASCTRCPLYATAVVGLRTMVRAGTADAAGPRLARLSASNAAQSR